ncbi:RsmB/NOP family class I SAM-dependent RNA methyltransferase [Candidatus Woesearchaeota archaeon]|jgi:tRNA (cytosine49-C5)-methyltransferase|nr:RsmB/NOP family class I SAM-dependent RNA methyltransferase [Candidatus Woesearchaeota archaeon]MBT6519506.1 RsmB/NOP family class I SAM-dependent RNA methyltransferase [Candidatus Woesearchaeota archaeon]MBT7367417.1 RsmB/NOP family class I SAM-dependent RNA methyltransferase [Candidatus Woesearchaeota archaeon]
MTNLTKNPNIEKLEWKPKMVERYSKLTDFDKFKEYSEYYLTKSIRINTLKKSIEEVKKRIEKQGFKLTQVPWCKEGFWIQGERTDIGNLLEHTLGYIYVQEAASMIPPVVLDPQPGDIVLDMCAAPGSKTTQIAAMIQNKGFIIANEIEWKRGISLGINVQRCGIQNYVLTNMRGQDIKGSFDKILIDAPCTATGTIRKSATSLLEWNPTRVKRVAKIQRELLEHGFNLLKPGGILVYSTCTLEPEENEGVVDFLINKFENAKVEPIDLTINRTPAVTEFEGATYSDEVKKTLRIWPQDNDSEGFFVARIKKEE